jgi:hypothetical protein
MVKIGTLLREGKLSRIGDLELERYLNFFESSHLDNLRHCEANITAFPRWAIISGYYAMHDVTKLLLAKKFRLKVEHEVHATTIKALRELIKNKQIIRLIERGYREFLTLAQDLEEAKRERIKAQYYTGTRFMHEEYQKRAKAFHEDVVLKYLKRIRELLE